MPGIILAGDAMRGQICIAHVLWRTRRLVGPDTPHEAVRAPDDQKEGYAHMEMVVNRIVVNVFGLLVINWQPSSRFSMSISRHASCQPPGPLLTRRAQTILENKC